MPNVLHVVLLYMGRPLRRSVHWTGSCCDVRRVLCEPSLLFLLLLPRLQGTGRRTRLPLPPIFSDVPQLRDR